MRKRWYILYIVIDDNNFIHFICKNEHEIWGSTYIFGNIRCIQTEVKQIERLKPLSNDWIDFDFKFKENHQKNGV